MAQYKLSVDNSTWYTFDAPFQGVGDQDIKKGAVLELLDGSMNFDKRATKKVWNFNFPAMKDADYQNLKIVFAAAGYVYLKVPEKNGGTTTYNVWFLALNTPSVIRPYGAGGDWARQVSFDLEEK